MAAKDQKQGGGFFASIASSLSNFGTRINGLLGYEGLEVINPEGGTEDAEEEAQRGRWKQEDRDGYWKMMHKYIGSDVTSMVTLPVLIFEPMTMIQKMAELMEYSHLLDLADECQDPYMRLVYASSWAISVYFAYQRTWKPFNPILGETYEMVNHGGVTFISEQVSHHPPMSAGHAENEHFSYDVTSKLKTKFLGNSVDVYPVGRTRVVLKRDGVVLDLVPPPTKVNNLIFGRTWVDSPGEMIMTNLTTGDKAVLYFQPCGWFGAGRYEVDGYIYNAAEEPKILMTGKWNEALSYQPCDMEGEPLPGTELKERKVLEAVTSILGNGICVGVLLEGEKVRDDNTTLLQSGICHEDGLDGLGFALEPLSSTASPPPICARGHTTQPLDAAMPLTRYPLIPSLDMGASDVPQEPLLSIASNYVGSSDEFHPSPTDMNVDNLSPNSRALVSIPPMNVEALAMVPVRHQSPRSEVQRRIRRPFSVTEVEALVLAVEKLGTGRWRDVKLRAFENAKHRTYVDLKDKWKTLVHTARISPQQRRGEPVPQELLDRVLAAHAYWSQQQAKQQLKQQDETCQLL